MKSCSSTMGIITGNRLSAHLTNSVISTHSLEIDMIYDPFPVLDIDDNDQSLDKLKKKPTRGTESDNEIILLLFISYTCSSQAYPPTHPGAFCYLILLLPSTKIVRAAPRQIQRIWKNWPDFRHISGSVVGN